MCRYWERRRAAAKARNNNLMKKRRGRNTIEHNFVCGNNEVEMKALVVPRVILVRVDEKGWSSIPFSHNPHSFASSSVGDFLYICESACPVFMLEF